MSFLRGFAVFLSPNLYACASSASVSETMCCYLHAYTTQVLLLPVMPRIIIAFFIL